jgi:hypothetical protein
VALEWFKTAKYKEDLTQELNYKSIHKQLPWYLETRLVTFMTCLSDFALLKLSERRVKEIKL